MLSNVWRQQMLGLQELQFIGEQPLTTAQFR